MKKLITLILAASMLTAGLPCSAAEGDSGASASAAVHSNTRGTVAFPGAEGGGMFAKGARAAQNMEVYHVTNLNDSGEGSFRDAVSKSGRIVVFDVSGMIDLSSNVTIKSNTTVLGQTAPGNGICFRGNNVKISGDNIIVRYIRFRVGSKLADGSDNKAQDGLEITDNSSNVIVDHCSVSWGTDENLTAVAVKDVTVQWSIVAEALNSSVHDKGEHSYGGIWGGVNLSMHHNIIATHKSRNPRIGSSETVSMTDGFTDQESLIDYRNNIIYNWGDKAGYGAENGTNVNIVNNFYRPGPATPAGKRARIFEISPGNSIRDNWGGSIFADGNYIDMTENDSDYADGVLVNAENWQIEEGTGVYLDKAKPSYVKLDELKSDYINSHPVTTTSAEEAYEEVINGAGARLPVLDIVDQRIIENIENREAPDGSKGSVGLVDSPEDGIPEGDEALYDERGYPIWEEITREADYDTDGDGIEDSWEKEMGLDSQNPNDSLNIGAGGYTWLEIFAEKDITSAETTVKMNVSSEILSENESLSLSADVLGDADNVEFYCDDICVGEIDGNGDFYRTESAIGFVGEAPVECSVLVCDYDDSGRLTGVSVHTADEAKNDLGKLSDSAKILVWDNLQDMNIVATEQKYNSEIYVQGGVHAVTAAVYKDNTVTYSPISYIYVSGENTLVTGQSNSCVTSGDFCYIAKIAELSNTAQNTVSGISANGAEVGIYYNSDFEPKLVFKAADVYTECDISNPLDYKYFKVQSTDGSLEFSVGKSLASWTAVGSVSASGEVTAGAFVSGEAYTVTVFDFMRLITEKTSPSARILNISENDRIDYSSELEIELTSDGDAAVSDVVVSAGDTVLAELSELDIVGQDTVTVPIAFDNIGEYTIEVVCVDENLSTATASVNVVVSADSAPWQLADIGSDEAAEKSYVYVTSDYTYKLNAIDGEIGGTSDKFTYLYQQFNDDARLYYRSRIQNGSQLGVVLRTGLTPDSESYFFGGEYIDGELYYNLKKRESDGAEYETVATADISGATCYFVFEKVGNKINIYKTENSTTVYATKTLLASCELSENFESYYLGYGATFTGSGSCPDVGWVAIEEASEESANYQGFGLDYGLDWRWQLQSAETLSPLWTDDEIAGRAGGKMLVETDDSYTDERYIFREFVMPDDLICTFGASVLLTGEEPALNTYYQNGSGYAYKVSFLDDGAIYINDTLCGSYSSNEWYDVRIDFTGVTKTPEVSASVYNSDGEVVAFAESLDGYASFRETENVKRATVEQAFYIEPLSGSNGRYYIDSVFADGVESSDSIKKVERFFKVSSSTALPDGEAVTDENGFTLSGSFIRTGDEEEIDGEDFTHRIRMGTSSQITFDVENGETVTVYAGTVSGTKILTLSDGTFTKTASATKTPAAHEITYTGDKTSVTLTVSGNTYIYGIKCTKYVEQ